MSDDWDDFWSKVPEKAIQPIRVKLLESLRRVGRPLSAVQLVNVLDGEVSMEEAEYHLGVLKALGLVEAIRGSTSEERPRDDGFDLPYRLEDQDPDDEE